QKSRKWLGFGRKSSTSKDCQRSPSTVITEPDDFSAEQDKQTVEPTKVCPPSPPQSQVDYGYGDAAPETAAQVDYGYDSAAPDSARQVDYGYGDAAPSPRARAPRRSSMKGSSPSRRASIGPCGEPMTLRLPGNQQPVRRRRSITFNNEVKVKKVEPARSLTPDPEALWFQDDEYDMIKEKTVALIHRASIADETEKGRKLCTRGLEKWMTPERTEVKKRQAWDNVLNEQYLQQQDGEFDEEHLAMMYKYSTTRSQVEASKRAQKDAQEIESYLASTRRYNRRMSM
ncbi:MAG: hypothetical protein SGILL_009278, partial [Bacillariaceae sp.]